MITTEVNLSNGASVKVGPLKYGPYKRIKQMVIQRISGRLAGILATSKSVDQSLIAAVLKEIAEDVAAVIDEMNTTFVSGCLLSSLDLDNLSAMDVSQLADEAIRINPIEKFLEMEKNSIAGHLARHLAGVLQVPPSESGSSPSNPNLYDPAGD